MLDKFMVTKGMWVWLRMEVAERRFTVETIVMEAFMLDKWVWLRMEVAERRFAVESIVMEPFMLDTGQVHGHEGVVAEDRSPNGDLQSSRS